MKSDRTHRRVTLWVTLFVIGCGFRLGVAFLPLDSMDLADHAHFVAWEREVEQQGLTRSYGDPRASIAIRVPGQPGGHRAHERWEKFDADRETGSAAAPPAEGVFLRPGDGMEYVARPTYGPAFMYVLAGITSTHRALDPELRPYTRTSLLLHAGVTALFNLILAAWLIPLAAHLGMAPGDGWKVFAWVWCSPALFLNETLRPQVDTWVLAWMCGAMLAFVRDRYFTSGVAVAIGVLTKPLALVAAPFLFLAFLARRFEAQPPTPSPQLATSGGASRLLRFSVGAGLAFLLLGLPFQLAEGSAWLRASLLGNVTALWMSEVGSWYAMNAWGGIQMLTGTHVPTESLGGLSWNAWGVLFFTIMGGMATALWWSRFGLVRSGWPTIILLLGIIGFFTMTSLTGRYLVYLLPFAILAAYTSKDSVLGLALPWLTLLICAHVTRHLWWPASMDVGFRGHDPAGLPAALMWAGIALNATGIAAFMCALWRKPSSLTGSAPLVSPG